MLDERRLMLGRSLHLGVRGGLEKDDDLTHPKNRQFRFDLVGDMRQGSVVRDICEN